MKTKAPARVLLRNAGTVVTMNSKLGKGPLGIVKDASVVLRDGILDWIGQTQKIPAKLKIEKELDLGGALLTPGLIDCHTHLMFGGDRSDEFFERLNGVSYERLAKRGGGIQKTVHATRKASDEELLERARRRLDSFLSFGVASVEVKSGYGLSVEAEIRMLRLIQNLHHDVLVVPTFMGAHTIPQEYRDRREKYVELVIYEMLPIVWREELSRVCDIFVDPTAFSYDEAKAICQSAKAMGFAIKLHGDQLSNGHGAELASSLGALSVDHLEHVSRKGIQALSKSKTVAVLLPGAVFFLGKKKYADARALIDAGVRVALSTDCNPGTSMTMNLPLIMTLAAVELKMSVVEIWKAVTLHAAQAVGLPTLGSFALTHATPLVCWDAETPEEVIYRFGSVTAKAVWQPLP